ncbi:MAG: RNA polymerase sigma factor [Ktedonobacterales bacterium]
MIAVDARGKGRPEEGCALMWSADELADVFGRAVPRLLRLARTQRVAPDALDDVVQETLLEAWRSRERLRDETRVAGWLEGICRNVCRRHLRRQGILRAREAALESNASEGGVFADLADPASFDPVEELTRQDRMMLLDRALGYLPRESRTLVERHYLAEIPQRELAEQAGLTPSALAARLHRARGQMLHTLSGELRAEALAVGLAVNSDDAVGWRATSMWCVFCGRQRLVGMFEPMADGRTNLRLRCPSCGSFEIESLGMVELANARSFLPATKKMVGASGRFVMAAMAAGGWCHCWICHRESQLHIVRDERLSPATWLVSSCGCLRMFASAVSLYGSLPRVRDFLFGIDRVVIGSEVELEYAGQRALRLCLLSPADGRRVDIFADAETLLPLAVVGQ